MADFTYLKSFQQRSEKARSKETFLHTFYSVLMADIFEAEQRLNLLFPGELEAFYKQIGYGFFISKKK